MNICAVVVWYNPDSSFVENILSYSSYCEKVYIVDNSISDNAVLCSKIQNAVYIPNFDNFGIAKALNQGCEKALSDGFEWCMTMDQDSSWEKEMLCRYISFCDECKSEKNVSFAPSFTNKSGTEIISVNKVITSGNIINLEAINLEAWKNVGKFYEPFFIDEVDFEFCYRLREHNYEITQICSIHMNHHLGTGKKHILPLLCHDGVRLYYMIRNALFIKSMHPRFYEEEHYARWLCYFSFRIIIESLLRFKVKNIFNLIYAYRDFSINKKGRF